jgi:uncharacterized protein
MTYRNLLLMGGFNHDFPATSAAIAGLLADLDIQTDISDDINGALAGARSYDLLTVNALRFTMDTERFADRRDEYGLHLSTAAREGILSHLADGGALLGIHTASICFDDFPQWGDLLGGVWDWDVSWHPPRGPIEVLIGRRDHPVVAGLQHFSLIDEVYHDLIRQPDIDVLVTGRAGGGSQPVVWTRTWQGSRIAYDALGHDVASISHPVHAALIRRAALWALSRPDHEVRETGPGPAVLPGASATGDSPPS